MATLSKVLNDYSYGNINKLFQIMNCVIVLSLITLSFCFSVDRSSQFIVDDNAVKRVYHGVNVVYKIPPFYPPNQSTFDPSDSLADVDLENLRSWGMNMIRLHVAWEAVEPVRGEYNYEYLAQIKNIVTRCEKYGIVVLLDAHQDVLSRFFCGEGFPDWAVSFSSWRFPFPLRKDISFDDQQVPLLEDCLKTKFLMYYLALDTAKTFDDFYHNVNGVEDAFADFWGVVADYFKDEPNVLGYEIINEPLASSPYRSLYQFLFPNVGNNQNLLPLYQKVSHQVRLHDQGKLLFFEPATTDLLGQHFNDSPGGLQWRDKEVFSYHIYCPLVDDNSVPSNDLGCKLIDTLFFQRKESAASQLGVGKFMTEFGAINDSPQAVKELNFLLSLMESRFTSWAYWEFKYFADITTQANPGNIESFYDDQGNIYQNKVKALARPYATAICGSPIQSSYDVQSHYFVLDWNVSKQCNGQNTTVFLSREFYFSKFKAHFKNCQNCQLKETEVKSYYEIVIPEEVEEGQQVILSIIQI